MAFPLIELAAQPGISRPDLWARLEDEGARTGEGSLIDLATVRLKCADGTAKALVREYLRFVYLTQVSDQVVAPSRIVDALWHEHLLHSRDYFDRFCAQVLGKTLHHAPGRPGPQDDPAHDHAKRLYREVFGEAAPWRFWPNRAQERRGKIFAGTFRLLGLVYLLLLFLFVAVVIQGFFLISETRSPFGNPSDLFLFVGFGVFFAAFGCLWLFGRFAPAETNDGGCSNGGCG